MRVPWSVGFPPIFTHSAWNGAANNAQPVLPDHTSYWPAKTKRDEQAALTVCDQICKEEVLELIYDCCFDDQAPSPLVVSPAMTIHDSQNALAIGYGKWLANEMGWQTDEAIFQAKTMSRDFQTSGWFRLAHEPEFYGQVEKGRRYVIADDVCTMGGTLAALRGFIESKGGSVICMTTLATGDGKHETILLEYRTLYGLTKLHNGLIAAACE